jgi:Protein of unknown function (DUF2844).
MPYRYRWTVVLVGAIVTGTTHATLGGLERDVSHEGQPIAFAAATVHPLPAVPQGVHQQTILNLRSITLTEYSANGTVFAILWSGPTMPDYRSLLGTYFPSYQQVIQTQPLSPGHYRAPVAIHQPNLVLHASGHMGAYQGSMYDPSAVPTGLSITSLGIEP